MVPEEVLHRVSRPARYIGREWNSTVKDWERTELKVALAYPDLYEIGMSNLGLLILYDILNRHPRVLAERVYTPWVDMADEMRRLGIPLFSLETGHPIRDFDVLGFSLGYELTYTNVLEMLDLAGIPLLSEERDGSFPLIIAGGTCALNPEPLSQFIDLFVLGDGEEVILELVELLLQLKGAPKEKILAEAACISGVYVPRFYKAEYHGDGTLKAFYPVHPSAPEQVSRRLVEKLPPPVTRPVVPYVEVVHDRGAVEIQRGCTRGCRFCQAGTVYRPVRERTPDEVIQAVAELLRCCGYHEISLLSLSTSDYPGIEGLVKELLKFEDTLISLPSLRMDEYSVKLMEAIPGSRKKGLTFAPEAGSERLRRVINKGVSDRDILKTMEAAFERGWTSLKLYFMLGLPTETPEDLEGIVELAAQGVRIGGRNRVRVSLSPFVPKPHTPFQWVRQAEPDSLRPRLESLKRHISRAGGQCSWHNPYMSYLEGILSRGDRRLGEVILRAWRSGCRFDAWTEHFDFEKWRQAFAQAGLSPEFYTRERGLEELLPWDHIDAGVRKAYLKAEYRRTFREEETSDCRLDRCHACGLERLHPECRRRLEALKGGDSRAQS